MSGGWRRCAASEPRPGSIPARAGRERLGEKTGTDARKQGRKVNKARAGGRKAGRQAGVAGGGLS